MVDSLRDIVAANRFIVLMVYGQVFFVMGLAIALQSSRHSRLAIAGSLKWLAAFGILHGLHEWGHMFLPIQAEYLPDRAMEVLTLAQAALLAVSFACLFQFGVELLRTTSPRWRPLRVVPGAVLVIWLFVAVGPTVDVAHGVADWYRMNSILARYMLCLPGALIAAFGLWRPSRDISTQLATPRVGDPLRLAAVALVGYAFLSGVIVPPGQFFPASWLNEEWFYDVFVLPVEVYRSITGAVLAIVVIRSMEVFRLELDRLIFSMERDAVQARERVRIGRDLHDHTLQKVYAAGLLLRSAGQGQPPESVTEQQHEQGLAMLDQAVADIRGYIGQLDSSRQVCTLAVGLEELRTDFRSGSPLAIDVDLDLPSDCGIDVDATTHLLAIAREAVSNATRHAQAASVHVRASGDGRVLHLTVEDDGTGLPEGLVPGYGLRNMRDRAGIIGARIDITSRNRSGTAVSVVYTLPSEDGS